MNITMTEDFDPDAYADRAAEALHRFRSAAEMARHKLAPVAMPSNALMLTIPEWPVTPGIFEVDAKDLLDAIYLNMRNAGATCVIALSYSDPATISKSCSIKSPCAGRLICGPDAGLTTVLLPSPIHGIIVLVYFWLAWRVAQAEHWDRNRRIGVFAYAIVPLGAFYVRTHLL